MFAQYSPLFTSGLLSESNTPSSSRRPSVELDVEPRSNEYRGSLPVDAFFDSFYEASTSEDDAILFTLAPRRRRSEVGNSFLSLDLAESRTMRSMSLRRKDTVTSRSTTHFGRSVPTSPTSDPTSPPMSFSALAQFSPASVPRKSLVRHSSREGLPGVKPVPSSDLPAPPHKRRPSDLTIAFSSPPVLPPLSLHRSTHSEPSLVSPISPILDSIERSYFAFSPPVSPPAATTSFSTFDIEEAPRSAPPEIPLRARPSVRSTVSFRTRQVNRSAALAALEGRVEGRAPRRQRCRSRPNNFMSMSDDEDDMDDVSFPSFPSFPSIPSFTAAPPASAPPAAPALLEVLREEEDVVVPTPTVASSKRSTPSSKKSSSSTGRSQSRSRRGTIESLLSPLTNFIDFRDDDGATRSWRSFVEIS